MYALSICEFGLWVGLTLLLGFDIGSKPGILTDICGIFFMRSLAPLWVYNIGSDLNVVPDIWNLNFWFLELEIWGLLLDLISM